MIWKLKQKIKKLFTYLTTHKCEAIGCDIRLKEKERWCSLTCFVYCGGQLSSVYIKVFHLFDGDIKKTNLWFCTPNPLLGNLSPNEMIKMGRKEKLEKFIDNALKENIGM